MYTYTFRTLLSIIVEAVEHEYRIKSERKPQTNTT